MGSPGNPTHLFTTQPFTDKGSLKATKSPALTENTSPPIRLKFSLFDLCKTESIFPIH